MMLAITFSHTQTNNIKPIAIQTALIQPSKHTLYELGLIPLGHDAVQVKLYR